jgi:hypothetical protein
MPTYQNALTQQPANRLAYQDRLGATPRNEYLGALADFLAQSYAPQRTQQMQGVAQFLGVPAVSQTLDRLSYGEPLTTGAGMTTRVRPEALEAAMTLAPLYRPAGMAAKEAVAMTKGMPVGMSTKAVGGMDFLRPGVAGPQDEALRLAQQRAALPPSQGGLGLPVGNTPQQRAAAMNFENRGFHETEGANIEGGLLNFDPRRVGAAASDEQTPYAMFVKPHGAGIGIARNNPAQMPLMVKSNLTDENIMRAFGNRDELQQYLNQFPEIKKATQAVRDLDHRMADYMGEIEKKADALYAQGKTQEADKLLDSLNADSKLLKEFDARTNELAAISKQKITDLFKSQGVGTVGLTNDAGAFGRNTVTEMVLNPAENVRSRFAAFDPFRRTAATAAAFGVAAPDLLAAEQQDDLNKMRKLKANKK